MHSVLSSRKLVINSFISRDIKDGSLDIIFGLLCFSYLFLQRPWGFSTQLHCALVLQRSTTFTTAIRNHRPLCCHLPPRIDHTSFDLFASRTTQPLPCHSQQPSTCSSQQALICRPGFRITPCIPDLKLNQPARDSSGHVPVSLVLETKAINNLDDAAWSCLELTIYRLLYLPSAKEEMRRRSTGLRSLHQPVREMRIQTAVMVGKYGTAKCTKGPHQIQDPTYQANGEGG